MLVVRLRVRLRRFRVSVRVSRLWLGLGLEGLE